MFQNITQIDNSNREKQVILLMIPNRKGRWHYLAVKKLSALLRVITLKNNGDFYCLNSLVLFECSFPLSRVG